MGPHEIANLTNGCAGSLMGLVLLVVGFVVARPAQATAGYLVAAAGGVQLLSSCCDSVMGSETLAERFGYMLGRGAFCAYGLGEAVVWGLVTYACVVLARAVVTPAAGGAS